MNRTDNIFLEATIEKAPTGKEWEVTIIGAQNPDDLMTIDGRLFVRSDNGRLYDTEALKNSAGMWDGIKVYDNHLTDDEFEERAGMRSVVQEWLGSIVKPRWDAAKKQLPMRSATFRNRTLTLERKSVPRRNTSMKKPNSPHNARKSQTYVYEGNMSSK